MAVEPTIDATTWQNWKDYAAAYVIPWIGEERLQRLDELRLLKLYRRLLADGRVKADNNGVMYAYWLDRIEKGEDPSPRELSDACKTTIHAARSAVRRYKSGIIPNQSTPGLAPKTVRNVHALIHRAFADAVAWKYISSNPASNVKSPKLARTRREVWAPDQIQTFLTAAQNDRFAALFVLELTTGIRRGQVCGLKWKAVDLDAGEITVHDNQVVVAGHAREKSGGKTKNADQTISIDRVTVAALRRWREVQNREREFFGGNYHPGDYVFTFEDGRPPHPDTPSQLRLVHYPYNPDAEDHQGIGAHSDYECFTLLKPTAAGLEVLNGAGEWIGHANVGFFLQNYAHVVRTDDRDAAEQAAAFLIGDRWDFSEHDS